MDTKELIDEIETLACWALDADEEIERIERMHTALEEIRKLTCSLREPDPRRDFENVPSE